MSTVAISHTNEAYCHVASDPQTMENLYKLLSFEVEGFQFTPQFKSGFWDGKRHLLSDHGYMYRGLVPTVQEHCAALGIECVDNTRQVQNAPSRDEIVAFIRSIPLGVEPWEHQVNGVVQAVRQERLLLQSCTASGKSLLIYLLFRWYAAHGVKKMLLIVPTVNLVDQIYGDFESYNSKEDKSRFDVQRDCCRWHATSTDEYANQPVLISTWQSLVRQPKNFTRSFELFCVDEAHTAQSDSITKILSEMTSTKYRFGTTGTLSDCKTDKLVLQGLIGKASHIATFRTMMDAAIVAQLQVKCVLLKYPKEAREAMKKCLYSEEVDILASLELRNRFIARLAASRKGNTLVLFQLVEKHGKLLLPIIEQVVEGTGRKVFFLSGAVTAKKREEIRHILLEETDAILVASYGVFSVGANVPNLQHVIMASPTKSRIKLLQSIGRGLRRGDKLAYAYDLADDLSWRKHENYGLKHFKRRIAIYTEEQMPFEIHNYELK